MGKYQSQVGYICAIVVLVGWVIRQAQPGIRYVLVTFHPFSFNTGGEEIHVATNCSFTETFSDVTSCYLSAKGWFQ